MTERATASLRDVVEAARAAAEASHDPERIERENYQLGCEERAALLRRSAPNVTDEDIDRIVTDKLEPTKFIRAAGHFLESLRSCVMVFSSATPGRGKTVAAAWVLSRIPGVFTEAPELCRLHSATFSDDVEKADHAISAKCLVIDDLGTETKAQQATDLLRRVMDERRSGKRITIITTNLTQAQMMARYSDARLLSRMGQRHFFKFISDTGEDMRNGRT